jgi:DNA-3-methyladenine glycosylase II
MIMNKEAINHLTKVDKKLGRLIKKLGPCTLAPKNRQPPYEALVEAVIFQVISGKAATTILNRFRALYPLKRFPSPSDVLNTPEEILRAVGLSRAKIASIKDIAQKTIDGTVPSSSEIKKMSDTEIIEHLTTIRGVGRWTVEMLLILKLGRADILPVTDYGIRKAFSQTFGKKSLPSPKALASYGTRWKPFRTTATWYLWKSLGGPY